MRLGTGRWGPSVITPRSVVPWAASSLKVGQLSNPKALAGRLGLLLAQIPSYLGQFDLLPLSATPNGPRLLGTWVPALAGAAHCGERRHDVFHGNRGGGSPSPPLDTEPRGRQASPALIRKRQRREKRNTPHLFAVVPIAGEPSSPLRQRAPEPSSRLRTNLHLDILGALRRDSVVHEGPGGQGALVPLTEAKEWILPKGKTAARVCGLIFPLPRAGIRIPSHEFFRGLLHHYKLGL